MKESDLDLGDGQTLHVFDTAPGDTAGRLVVFWHHGTPNIGTPPAPLFPASDPLGIRWVSYDRPGYGGSTPCPGRDLASAAGHVSRVADALGIERFAVMGHSGGGSHALACGALLADRVLAVVSVSGLAPYGAAGLDWFAGMYASGQASLRAAVQGRAAKERHEASAEYDPEMFTPADHAALEGEWSWFGSVVGPALEGSSGGSIADDLAYVSPWGCDPAQVTAPVLLVHGDEDRVVPCAHGEWLARTCPTAELRLSKGDGHISALHSAPAALHWLRATARQPS
ncbi:alpha/beta hydrolase [Nonomuraea sp. K274]|uniref:Alpha/beta hydrolase n=1 Tax=Nonomuraea cypriaca TaxID=1187855 RepID=A0A931ABZ8_9ACTN|nr:alpha/beta hydrolase [Nonomuraea cypriaca]MBF8190167.1 alpha/beta hydrolase [Nonomuraea cypriaca]